ncbi:MAG: hypothetical protein CMJ23_06330 [Phycisphaerae bacterium]|nr:hypothetical protein [Phycisphaerae bacterium]
MGRSSALIPPTSVGDELHPNAIVDPIGSSDGSGGRKSWSSDRLEWASDPPPCIQNGHCQSDSK